jgi:hypothetical protein
MAYAKGAQAGNAFAERQATFDLQYPVAQAGMEDAMASRQANLDNYQFQAQALRDAAALPPEQRAAFLAQRVQETLQGLDATNPAASRQAATLAQFALRQSDAFRQAGNLEGAKALGQTGFGVNPAGMTDASQRDMQGYVNALQNTDAPYYFSTTQNKWIPLAAERAMLAQYGGQPAAPTGGVPAYAGVPQASIAPGMPPPLAPALSPTLQVALQGGPAGVIPGSTGPTLAMPAAGAYPETASLRYPAAPQVTPLWQEWLNQAMQQQQLVEAQRRAVLAPYLPGLPSEPVAPGYIPGVAPAYNNWITGRR